MSDERGLRVPEKMRWTFAAVAVLGVVGVTVGSETAQAAVATMIGRCAKFAAVNDPGRAKAASQCQTSTCGVASRTITTYNIFGLPTGTITLTAAKTNGLPFEGCESNTNTLCEQDLSDPLQVCARIRFYTTMAACLADTTAPFNSTTEDDVKAGPPCSTESLPPTPPKPPTTPVTPTLASAGGWG